MTTTVSAWETLRQERRARETATLASIALDSRNAIEATAERQIEAMRDLAASWARFGPRSLAAWRFDAGRVIEIFPGLVTLGWVGPEGDVVRVVDEGETVALPDSEERSALLALAERVETTQRVLMAGPRHEADRGWTYDLVVPSFDGEERAGVLVAGVSLDAMLDAVLHDSAPGYAVSIRWGEHEIYRRGETDASHTWWMNRGPVVLSPGVSWKTAYTPTRRLVADSLAPWPDYFLAGGLLISVMLGVLVHQLRTAEGEVRNLDDLNRELERRVEERTHELADAVSELEAFNYSVSHDLRSPLGSILTFASLLEEDLGEDLAPEALEMLERIRGSAETSMDLLEGLLELSRAGRAELHGAKLDLAELTREIWAEAAPGDGSAVRLEIGALPEAHADPVLLRQVLTNLIRNAVKFSALREKPRIEVGGERLLQEDVYYVRDNGAGFDMRFAGKLFKPFERLHSERDFQGTGIGLAIVRRIVNRHGGRVWAEGELDEGATFFFTLPHPPRRPA